MFRQNIRSQKQSRRTLTPADDKHQNDSSEIIDRTGERGTIIKKLDFLMYDLRKTYYFNLSMYVLFSSSIFTWKLFIFCKSEFLLFSPLSSNQRSFEHIHTYIHIFPFWPISQMRHRPAAQKINIILYNENKMQTMVTNTVVHLGSSIAGNGPTLRTVFILSLDQGIGSMSCVDRLSSIWMVVVGRTVGQNRN